MAGTSSTLTKSLCESTRFYFHLYNIDSSSFFLSYVSRINLSLLSIQLSIVKYFWSSCSVLKLNYWASNFIGLEVYFFVFLISTYSTIGSGLASVAAFCPYFFYYFYFFSYFLLGLDFGTLISSVHYSTRLHSSKVIKPFSVYLILKLTPKVSCCGF